MTFGTLTRFLPAPAVWLTGLLSLSGFSAPALAAEPLEYNRHVRPILAENCFACHGPDSAARKADLRLDQREAAVAAGAISPGKADESELLRRVLSNDPEEMMPPPATKKLLTAAQKEILRQWLSEGAAYQPHWSLIAPVRPPLPAVKEVAWCRNPIDYFVLAKLEAAGLQPAPEADRRTLARRVSLDLTGLPPKPEWVEAFVNDASPDAYEKYVDHLMNTAAWGEHRGRYWLDVARYADTHGIHFDNYREVWTYRDWVIRAFNRNVPFDQFTIEQLAGDLLPNRTLDQQIASGFNRCNITTNEGGAISEEYEVLYTRDRTETTSLVWLGTTAGCCVCHDHKFDPMTQREFYELAAFFNNTTQQAMDGNIKDTPPVLFVPRTEDRPRWEALASELAADRKQADDRKASARPEFDGWLASATADTVAGLLPNDGLRFYAELNGGGDNSFAATFDGQPRTVATSAQITWEPGHVAPQALLTKPGVVAEIADVGDLEKDQAFSYGAWVKLANTEGSGAIFARMDDGHDYRGWDLWMEGGRVGCHIINRWPDDALKVVSNNPIKANEWTHVFVTYDGSAQIDGVKVYMNGQVQPVGSQANALKNTIRTDVPFKLAQRHSSSRLDEMLIEDVRIYGRALPPDDVYRLAQTTRAAALLAKPVDQRSDADKNELYDWWLRSLDTLSQQLAARIAGLQQEESAIKSRGTQAHVMQERNDPAMAYVLYRGDYDKRRDPVQPETPDMLPPMPAELPKNRLGFAQWLLLPEHPLTARVTVNRFWQEVFGTGIVRTAGDLGVAGELPSHPELVDWLAVDFREGGWDVRRFFKQLVTSATYRQAAANTPEKLEKDPQNRLLSRGPRFRMDAEMIRDYALAASGLLVEKVGGPSVRPYQPEGVWEAVAMIGSNTRDYKADDGDSLYRRSLYTFWKRAAPPASMDIFNAPSREVCAVRRERTDTPLQALVTLNDPQFIEAARRLAEGVIKQGGDSAEGRLDLLARRLLARPWRAEEAPAVQAALADLSAWYQGHVEEAKQLIVVGESKADTSLDPATLAAWTMLANELMNLDEVLNK
ncbi:MAG TPA: DUF1553 domain-containing protein [Pirellulales bacterium]|jgi:hypothetical protein|nr:DUF1553 domain-containing protein [Pirellulales bacterium]